MGQTGTASRFAHPFFVSRKIATKPKEPSVARKDFKSIILRGGSFVGSRSNTPGASSMLSVEELKLSPRASGHAGPSCLGNFLDDAHLAGRLYGSEGGGSPMSHLTANSGDDPSLNVDLVFGLDLGQDLDIMSPDFNVLLIRDQAALKQVVSHIFLTMVDQRIHMSKNILKEYVHEVAVHYRPNPFHNFHHAVTVLQFLAVMLKTTREHVVFSEINVFAFLLSALVHDVDHPGKTNLFEINSGSALALLYNDLSVLENHHCSTAFRLMQKPGTNILSRLPFDQKKEVRKTLISCVLATDMSKHSELIEDAKGRHIASDRPLDAADQQFFGKLFLHAADLSGPTKEFLVAREWASRVTEEFNAQVLVEVDLGLPVLSFMAAADEKTFLKNEIGFSGFFVAPLWRIVSKLCPELEYVHSQLERNINQYKSLREEKERQEYASTLEK